MIADSAIIPFLFLGVKDEFGGVFVATFFIWLQLFIFRCNFHDFVATFTIWLQLSNFLLIPTRFSRKKAAHRASVGLTN